MPRDLLDGPMTALSGQDRAHASLFPLLEGDAERPIIGIYGPTFIASSVPAAPLSLWESRFRGRLATIGSPECALIWKAMRLPCGALMSRLTPSERLTKDTASTGWPTPTVFGNYNRKGASPASGDGLATAMRRSGWATPRGSDGEKGGPNSRDGSGSLHLPAQQFRAGWATPCARDGRSGRRSAQAWQKRLADARGIQLNDQMTQASGLPLKMSGANGTKNGGVPNPEFPCWLMGFPAALLRFLPSAIRSSRRSRPK